MDHFKKRSGASRERDRIPLLPEGRVEIAVPGQGKKGGKKIAFGDLIARFPKEREKGERTNGPAKSLANSSDRGQGGEKERKSHEESKGAPRKKTVSFVKKKRQRRNKGSQFSSVVSPEKRGKSKKDTPRNQSSKGKQPSHKKKKGRRYRKKRGKALDFDSTESKGSHS